MAVDGSVSQFTGYTNGSAVSADTSAIFGQGPLALPQVPWSDVNSRFFQAFQIDPSRWDQLFPYRLLVIDTNNSNQIVNGKDATDINTTVTVGTGSTVIDFQTFGTQWVYQLPISPEQLRISDQYAISTSATLRGVIEEHNGVKFKNILASGSFGVWPFKESVTKPPGSPGIVSSLFGSTIASIGNVTSQFQSAVSAATGNSAASKPKTVRPENSASGKSSTGYFQALALTQFLEQYAEAKKIPNNSGWRLIFDIPKQNQAFVVTPMAFEWSQSVQDPMAIHFSLQMKAWRRIDLNENAFVADPDVQTLTPGILARVLNTLAAARATVSASLNLIASVRSDVEAPLDALRQTALLVKDLAGVVITAADLPFELAADYKSAIAAFISDINLGNAARSSSSSTAVIGPIRAIKASAASNEGLSLDAINSGQLGAAAAHAQSIDPALSVLSNPQANYGLMDTVKVNSLSLTTAQKNAVNQVVQNARTITVDDLKRHRATVQELTLQLSNSFGANDARYSKIYGKAAPTKRAQAITLDEYDILKKLYDVLQCYDILTATTKIDDRHFENSMAYVSGLAQDSGIAFSIPNSKIQLPVPFGATIEGIARRYLGNPERWLEIATLNNLRAPYIDENGFKLSLLSNATGRQITVNSQNNLFVGQRVLVNSANQSPSPRVILNIDRLSSTSYLLTLDGLANLDGYTVASVAYLQAYLPGTVNSQQKIFIPSSESLASLPNIVPPPSTSGDPLVGLSKVDFLLTETGDLAINSFGDFRLASGITNLIQAIRIKLATPKGSIPHHLEFGLGLKSGIPTSAVNTQDIYKTINKLVKQDSRFSGLTSLQVVLTGPTLTINMGVRIANNRGVYPLSFTLT